jgi:hypothetical protein
MPRKTAARTPDEELPDVPAMAEQDWSEIEGADVAVEGNSPVSKPNGDLAEEEDDNPYQGSDEALPDDAEERVLSRDPSKEGSRFDEV